MRSSHDSRTCYSHLERQCHRSNFGGARCHQRARSHVRAQFLMVWTSDVVLAVADCDPERVPILTETELETQDSLVKFIIGDEFIKGSLIDCCLWYKRYLQSKIYSHWHLISRSLVGIECNSVAPRQGDLTLIFNYVLEVARLFKDRKNLTIVGIVDDLDNSGLFKFQADDEERALLNQLVFATLGWLSGFPSRVCKSLAISSQRLKVCSLKQCPTRSRISLKSPRRLLVLLAIVTHSTPTAMTATSRDLILLIAHCSIYLDSSAISFLARKGARYLSWEVGHPRLSLCKTSASTPFSILLN